MNQLFIDNIERDRDSFLVHFSGANQKSSVGVSANPLKRTGAPTYNLAKYSEKFWSVGGHLQDPRGSKDGQIEIIIG